jgi:hypothetical protein
MGSRYYTGALRLNAPPKRPIRKLGGSMSTPATPFGEIVWELPPLILHPFNERVSPATLLENSKAALMLSGLIPPDGSDEEELKRRLVVGRYGELRMLYFVGKDVFRWVEQCLEWTARSEALRNKNIHPQSFAELLTAHPPPPVREKLVRWGVVDFGSIFSRAIGLNVMFGEPPSAELFTEEFLRNYHRYADALHRAFLAAQSHRVLTSANFIFELYASGEYSRILEAEWTAD